jgi:hypothetical protein
MYKAMVNKGKLILVKGEQGQVKPTIPNRPQFLKKIKALEDEECVNEDISGECPDGDELEVSKSKH